MNSIPSFTFNSTKKDDNNSSVFGSSGGKLSFADVVQGSKPAEKPDQPPKTQFPKSESTELLSSRLSKPRNNAETLSNGKKLQAGDSVFDRISNPTKVVDFKVDKNTKPFQGIRNSRKLVKTSQDDSAISNKPNRPSTRAPLFASLTQKTNHILKPNASRSTSPSIVLGAVDETDEAKFITKKENISARLTDMKPKNDNNLFKAGPSRDNKSLFTSRVVDSNTFLKPKQPQIHQTISPEIKTITTEGSELLRKLKDLEGRECPGDYDKYTILDERDKILCKLRSINGELIKKIERCEEMCTEKERYMRIVQKRASEFECDEASCEPCHEMMIKEYARSAADQEKPLPHELRSEKMMNHTMSYLLINVLDNFPDNSEQKAAWYNFLWSRTRAVRKEVTQLSMSDKLAVDLVERCTRLHILFGYILCTLEMDHFDQKMNNENLGKCLQTLRHLYEDFGRRGIECPNEAEFRSYDVLLHMNDTNVLSQVLSYRQSVRRSTYINLALQLCTSFQNNNYCRFFRLLKSRATYLQCCVAHKLFNEMREKAITTMTSSYGRNASYPVDKLCNMLAFDSAEDVLSTMTLYGIKNDTETDHVVFNRDFLSFGDPVPMKLYKWIDDKKNGKYSQVVYGCRKFQFFSSRVDVSNSFDFHNRFINDKVTNMILGMTTHLMNASTVAPTSTVNAEEEKKKKDEEAMKIKQIEMKNDEITKNLSNRIIDDLIKSFVEEERMKWNIIQRKKKLEEEHRRKMAELEEKRKENLRKRAEIEDKLAKKLSEKLESDVVEELVNRFVFAEIRNRRLEIEDELTRKILDRVWSKKVSKSIDSYVIKMCQRLIDEKHRIEEGLELFRQKVERRWLLQFWNRWREWIERKKESKTRRHQMLKMCVPVWDSTDVQRELVNKYTNSNKSVLDCNVTYLDKTYNFFVRFKAMQRRRSERIARAAFIKWKSIAFERKSVRKLVEVMSERERKFYKSFDVGDRIERKFQFDKPYDTVKVKRRKEVEERKHIEVYDEPNCSVLMNDSISLAREQLDRNNWTTYNEIPMEFKEKMKRQREEFENEVSQHDMKRRKQGRELLKEFKLETNKKEVLTKEADELLEEAARVRSEMQQLMNEFVNRKVSEL